MTDTKNMDSMLRGWGKKLLSFSIQLSAAFAPTNQKSTGQQTWMRRSAGVGHTPSLPQRKRKGKRRAED